MWVVSLITSNTWCVVEPAKAMNLITAPPNQGPSQHDYCSSVAFSVLKLSFLPLITRPNGWCYCSEDGAASFRHLFLRQPSEDVIWSQRSLSWASLSVHHVTTSPSHLRRWLSGISPHTISCLCDWLIRKCKPKCVVYLLARQTIALIKELLEQSFN